MIHHDSLAYFKGKFSGYRNTRITHGFVVELFDISHRQSCDVKLKANAKVKGLNFFHELES